MDNELFELCKEVYRRTQWAGIPAEQWFGFKAGTLEEPVIRGHTPCYTTDYLLEKLPPALWVEVSGEGQQVALLALNMQGNGEAIAVYAIPYDIEFRGAYSSRADTPLKALLNLVIALDKAGQLKGDK